MDDALAANVTIAAVGTGDLEYARHFAEEHRVTFPLMVDDRSVSYRAVGTKKGSPLDLVKPSVLANGAKALGAGNRQGKPGRAPMVYGAAHVIRPDSSVTFAWINDDFSDNAPIDEVLAAAR